jgi:hypothetical protein
VALSRARLGLYVFGRRSLFANCFELQPAFSRLLARPTQVRVGELGWFQGPARVSCWGLGASVQLCKLGYNTGCHSLLAIWNILVMDWTANSPGGTHCSVPALACCALECLGYLFLHLPVALLSVWNVLLTTASCLGSHVPDPHITCPS